jgi:hypothetical protein
MFKKLEPRLDFGWTVRILGFISLIIGGLAIVLMKTRFLSSRTTKWNANSNTSTDNRFVLTVGAMFFIDSAYPIPKAYITTYALSKGVEESLAYQLLAVMNAAQTSGRAIPG